MSIADKLQTIAENEQLVYEAGHEAGQQAEYDRFWDIFQDYGKRTDYRYAFSDITWNESILKPKYKNISPTLVSYFFALCPIKDLRKHLADNGVTIDLSKATVIESIGRGGLMETFPTISTVSANSLAYIFYGTQQLREVDKVILKSDGSQTLGNGWFGNCHRLKEIRFEGVIGTNVGFPQSAELSHDSLVSLISVLKDFSGTNTTRTLTLHATAKALLTETDINTIAQKGWILA